MGDGSKILIVDDDPGVLSLMQGVLERNRMATLTARSATEADAALESFAADLIVLDVMLDGDDGLSFCKRVRRASRLPVIMVSALAEDIDRIIGLEIGADDDLSKPFNPRQLVACIKTVLRRTRGAWGRMRAPVLPLPSGHCACTRRNFSSAAVWGWGSPGRSQKPMALTFTWRTGSKAGLS